MEKYFNIRYEFDKAVVQERIAQKTTEQGAGYICVADANILQQVHNNIDYRKVVDGSMFSICDSSWVPIFVNRIYGIKHEHYCGSMIFKDIIEMKRYRQFFMGTSTEVLTALKANLTKMDPAIDGMTFYELPFCKVEDFDYPAIAEMVNRDNPDIIWVALGAPKQEKFIKEHFEELDVTLMLGLGGSLDGYAGVAQRAPKWMIDLSLEWLYRLLKEPKRLGRMMRLPKFVLACGGEKLRRKKNG